MAITDYEYHACRAAKVLGSRLVRASLHEDTTLYGLVVFAHWSAASPDRLDRQHWYEVSFKPLGKRVKDNWISMSPSSDSELNRLHFRVQERTAAHPEGAASVAKLGPIGHVRMLPTSIGLGTYLRDQLIDWVACLHPEASVAKGSLSSVDGGADNLERRNRFYLGGKFEISVQDDGSGAFWAERLDGLRRGTAIGNVQELHNDDLHRLLRSATELEKVKPQMAKLIDECQRLQTTLARAKACIFWAKIGAFALVVGLGVATVQGMISWHLF